MINGIVGPQDVLAEDLVQYDEKDLVILREYAGYVLEEYEGMVKMINQELLFRLKEQKVKGKVIRDFAVSIGKRVNIKTTLEEAKSFGAIIEAVDTKKLKELYSYGVPIPNITETEYLLVRSVQKSDEEEANAQSQ